jgi:hypothetical protein
MSEPTVIYIVSPDAPPADPSELIEAVVRLLVSIDERATATPKSETRRKSLRS